jgi:hydroxymethylglutaryl-CoA reductase
MSLHARQIALAAGAHGAEVDELAKRMIGEGAIKPARAAALLAELRRVPA